MNLSTFSSKRKKNRAVRLYWLHISRRNSKVRENFCERCGRGIGKDHIYHELLDYKGHKICLNCFEDKQRGIRLPIDIEDYTKKTKAPIGYIPVAER